MQEGGEGGKDGSDTNYGWSKVAAGPAMLGPWCSMCGGEEEK